MAVDLVGIQNLQPLDRIFQVTNHDFTVSSNFKHAVSAVKRTGHARFRRGPSLASDSQAPSTSTQSAPLFTRSTVAPNECSVSKSVTDTTTSSPSTSSSSLAGGEEGSVSNGKQFVGLGIVAPAPAFSSRKPPLPASHRKRCRADRPSVSLPGSRTENQSVSRKGCHCCKRRKISSKRETRRVPITGSKVASIPADDYSWKKYGEKKTDGSPYPTVYYKCDTGIGCPARKRVEIALDDSKMLLVTYAGEHNHRKAGDHIHQHAPTPILTGLSGLVVQSKGGRDSVGSSRIAQFSVVNCS